ncbi:MAG: branched-chain amino acid ABC transporter permease [Bacillota bacterium]
MNYFIQQLINGITLGGIYVLITTGFSVVYSVLRMMNFAHGDVYMFGVYVATTLLLTVNLNPLLAIMVGVLTGGILAALVQIIGYRPLRGAHPMMVIVTAVAIGWIIRNAVQLIWGVRNQPFPSLLGGGAVFHFGQINVPISQLEALAFAMVIIVCFNIFLRRHKVGHAITMVAQDIEVSSLMGIAINRIVTVVYFIAGAMGVAGGLLFASTYSVIYTTMGFNGTIIAFTAAIIGGMGSLSGALAGGMVLGLAQSLSAAYLSPGYRDAITFTLLIAILLVRPQGILGQGKVEEEKV